MAALKRITGIVLCVCVFLLMSHNTSALSFSATDTRSYSFNTSYGNSGAYLTNEEDTHWFINGVNYPNDVYLIDGALNIAIPTNTKRINGYQLGFTSQTPNKYIMNVSYRFCPNNPDNLKSWIGFSTDAYSAVLQQDWIVNGSCINGSVSVFGAVNYYNVRLGSVGGGLNAGANYAGGSIIFNKPTFIVLSDDANYSSVLNAIKNNTDDIKTKLQQLEEAAETEQEAAQKELDSVENIENQSADDYEMESANMSSLFSQFGGFITAVSGAHVGDCNIPANLNHINLGILDLCNNPVPDYAQVAVSIIVCMLIAPYLLNIIKRIIGIADKVREV